MVHRGEVKPDAERIREEEDRRAREAAEAERKRLAALRADDDAADALAAQKAAAEAAERAEQERIAREAQALVEAQRLREEAEEAERRAQAKAADMARTRGALGGTATLATGDTLSVSLNGATYNNVSVVNGHWSIDTSSVQPSSGTLGGLVAGNSYPVTATAKDSLGNVSVDLTTNELNIVAPPATPVVTLPVPPTATPMYAVVLPTGDRWLSSSASEAHPLALVYSSGKAVVDFYISLTAGSDTLALQAWRNVVTGDYVYLPANAKLPYACYVPNTEATLGFVPAAGHGAGSRPPACRHNGPAASAAGPAGCCRPAGS